MCSPDYIRLVGKTSTFNKRNHSLRDKSRFWEPPQDEEAQNVQIILLRIAQNYPVAVVEAKAAYKKAGDGLQQAKQYASLLGLRFAFSTNGHSIIEYDDISYIEKAVNQFPSPEELWLRLRNE